MKIRKAFANGSSANIKVSKTQLSKMIHSGGFNILGIMNQAELVCKIANKAKDLSNKKSLEVVIKTANSSRKILPDPKKLLTRSCYFGAEINLTNNEIKDFMGRTNSFENRGILLKGATTKITSQEGRFPNFLRPLSTAGSPLMKIIFTSLAKSVLLPFELSAAISATDAAM